MYRMIVARRARAVWREISLHHFDAPVAMAAADMHFRFVGDTSLQADLVGREQFRAWLDRVARRFPDLEFEVLDVAVVGWPWHTRVSVRLRLGATLADGSRYANEASQWITLRWGKMTDDWVLEDTLALSRALAVQSAAVPA